MSGQREEIQPEQIPLKSDTDQEKQNVENNSSKVTFQSFVPIFRDLS